MRSEAAQIWTRDHPSPSLMEPSRVDGVEAPLHFKTRRSHTCRAQVVANASMKKQLKEIEDKILYMLSNSTGNILDDHEVRESASSLKLKLNVISPRRRPTQLIETLASSKITSTEITEKVADAEVTEREIDAYRERYRPVAYRATILYFSVVNLCVVDPMYQCARRVP